LWLVLTTPVEKKLLVCYSEMNCHFHFAGIRFPAPANSPRAALMGVNRRISS
jgi:hypothetical protein